jgi:CheY-like chemotaxis protein
MVHFLASLRQLCQNYDDDLSFFVIQSVQVRTLIPLSYWKLLDLQVVVLPPSLIQVGTFLASSYLEEVRAMTDSNSSASKKTVMVVDDNPDIVAIVKTILEVEGYALQFAYNGQEVFNLLGEQKPDLIILDIFMPKIDGLEVLTRLKGDPDTASIPVILLTSKVEYKDVLEGYQMGANYYITKPFTKGQLLEGINLVFDGDQDDSIESP